MSDANIYSDIVDGIVTVLRDNITDPDTARSGAGRHFIFDRFPNNTATFPRISVTVLPHGETEELDVETDDELIRAQVQIDIWTDAKTSHTISSAVYNRSKMLDYLAGQVSKVMKSNRSSLRAYNIMNVKRTRPFGAMGSGEENILRSLGEYAVIYHQSYS